MNNITMKMGNKISRSDHSIIPYSNHSNEQEIDILNALSDGYKAMVNNEEFSDFVFVVKGKKFYAHKVILASISSVFAAMFRSDMIEKQENKAIIDDIDCDVFEEFLTFVYTGKSSKISELADKLLPVADKYDIIKLKSLCERNIHVDNENVVRVLITAYEHNVSSLKQKAILHVIRNLKVVRDRMSIEWINLIKTYPELVDEIFSYVETRLKVHEGSNDNFWLYNPDSDLEDNYIVDTSPPQTIPFRSPLQSSILRTSLYTKSQSQFFDGEI